jgi:hypothetical protein
MDAGGARQGVMRWSGIDSSRDRELSAARTGHCAPFGGAAGLDKKIENNPMQR